MKYGQANDPVQPTSPLWVFEGSGNKKEISNYEIQIFLSIVEVYSTFASLIALIAFETRGNPTYG